MKKLLIIGALVLAGCSDPVKDAERELEIVESSGGSSADICAAREKVADAHLKAHDQQAYRNARLSADVQCMNARFERQYGPAS
jgi:hypothetical protein